ncbi:MAG: hypothetical protein P8010_13845 [Desulfosarcinaceae bacterium]
MTKTTLIAKRERLSNASIFPFFDASGQVRQLMVLLPDFNTAFMIPFAKGLAGVSFMGTVRLSMDSAEIESHANFTGRQIDHLYHYDPNWHLSHERFAGYRARDLLKQTNCADPLRENVRHLIFSNDLSAVKRFVMRSRIVNLFRPVHPEILLASFHPTPLETGDPSDRAKRPWRLDPIWKRWGQD